MHELMFQAGVKGTSERSELIPCINYKVFTHTLVYHTFPCNPVVNFHPLHRIYLSLFPLLSRFFASMLSLTSPSTLQPNLYLYPLVHVPTYPLFLQIIVS